MFGKIIRLSTPFVVMAYMLFAIAGKSYASEERMRTISPYASVTSKFFVVVGSTSSSVVTTPMIAPLKAGERAPFDGVLLNPQAVASVVATIDNIPNQIAVETKKATATADASCSLKITNVTIELEYQKKTAELRIKNQDQQIELLTKEIKSNEVAKTSNWIWLGVGVVGGILLTSSTIYLISAVK